MKEVINNNNNKNNNDNTGVWAIFTTIAIPVISTLKNYITSLFDVNSTLSLPESTTVGVVEKTTTEGFTGSGSVGGVNAVGDFTTADGVETSTRESQVSTASTSTIATAAPISLQTTDTTLKKVNKLKRNINWMVKDECQIENTAQSIYDKYDKNHDEKYDNSVFICESQEVKDVIDDILSVCSKEERKIALSALKLVIQEEIEKEKVKKR